MKNWCMFKNKPLLRQHSVYSLVHSFFDKLKLCRTRKKNKKKLTLDFFPLWHAQRRIIFITLAIVFVAKKGKKCWKCLTRKKMTEFYYTPLPTPCQILWTKNILSVALCVPENLEIHFIHQNEPLWNQIFQIVGTWVFLDDSDMHLRLKILRSIPST